MKSKALTKDSPQRVTVPSNIVMEPRGGALPAWTLFIVPLWILLFFGCMTAAKKAQKEADKIEDARQKEIAMLEKVRKLYPCDTSSTVIDTTTAIRFLQGESIVSHDTVFRTDTLIRDHVVNKQHTVVDSAAVKQLTDSLNSTRYSLGKLIASQNKTIAELTYQNAIYKKSASNWGRLITWLSIGGIASFIAIIAILFFKLKSKIGL